MRFLIVDDNPHDRELIRWQLQQAFPDSEFVEVSQRAEFEAVLAEGGFDLALTDYQLNWTDGLRVLRALRERFPQLPVVMVTGTGSEEVAAEGMKLGLSDYVLKGYLRRLPVAVQESLEKDRLRREREDAIRQLSTLEKGYHTIAELVSDYAYTIRIQPNGRLVREWKAGALPRLTGYSPEELNPQDWLKITHPEDLPIAQQHFQHLLSGQTDVCEVRIVMKTGEVRWLRNYARPIWDEAERRVVRVYGAVQDVTERKQTEAALRESEARFHVLSQAAFEGVAISEGGVLLEANERLALMLGYELNELIGKPVADLVAPEAREYAAQQIRSGSEQPYESIAQRKDGSTFPVKVQGRAMPYGGRTVRVAEVRDITERKQRERELEVIATVSAALRAAANGAEMPPIILDQVLTLLKTEGAALDVLDPASGEIVTELGRGAWAGVTGLRTPPGEGLSSHIIATGQPYVTDDVSLEPRVARPDLLGGLSTVACIPLITRAQTIGALWVGRKTPFTQYELRLVTAIADIAASALQRATLHDQTRQRLQQLAALRAIDFAISSSLDLRLTLNVVLEQVTSQLGVDAADVLLLNPHAHTLEFAAGRGFRSRAIERSVLRLGQGYPGRAALERRLVSLPNLADEEPDLTRAPLLEGEDFQAYFGIPLVAKGKVEGVLEVFHRAPLSPDPERLEFLETLAGQAAIAIDNAQLFNDLQRSNLNLTLAYDATIEGWSRALDLRDKETEGHTQRVTDLTLRLARALGAFSDAELVHVRRGALLHDIGKMGIPDRILLKPGPLDEAEWAVMRQHPVYAYDLLAPILFLRPALDIPYCHHEKWDGTGYPRGLKGEAIPLAARIFAVVDVWDALCSDRPYRQSWPEERVREHMRAGSGAHFDPQVVEAFLRVQEGA